MHTRADDGAETAGLAWVAGLPENEGAGGRRLQSSARTDRPINKEKHVHVHVRHAARLSARVAALSLALTATAQAQTPAPNPHLARNLAATCANCHGTNGQALGEMKPLAGTPAERTIALMNYYKTTAQPEGVTIMHQIAKGYTDEQIRLIAGFFAAQQPRK